MDSLRRGRPCTMLLLLVAVFTSQVIGVPSQVENVRLSREVIDRKPALNVSWDAPSGDQDIERYEVKYRRNMHIKDNPWRFVNIAGSPPATTTNLTNLWIGTTYRLVVRAWSEAGPGRWSDLALLGTYGVLKPSFNDQSLKEVVVLKVNWTTPEAEDLLPPNHYLVQYRKVGKLPQNPWNTVNITGSPPPTTAYLEGLSASAPHGYWVRVIAVSTVGSTRRWPMQQFRISGI